MLKLIARLYAVVVVGLSSQAWSFDLVMDASSIGTLPVEEIEVVGKRPVRWNTWPVVWLSNGGYQVGGGGFQPMNHSPQQEVPPECRSSNQSIAEICASAVKGFCKNDRGTATQVQNACSGLALRYPDSMFFRENRESVYRTCMQATNVAILAIEARGCP